MPDLVRLARVVEDALAVLVPGDAKAATADLPTVEEVVEPEAEEAKPPVPTEKG